MERINKFAILFNDFDTFKCEDVYVDKNGCIIVYIDTWEEFKNIADLERVYNVILLDKWQNLKDIFYC